MQVPFSIIEYSKYDPKVAKEQEVFEYRIYIGRNKPLSLYTDEFIPCCSDEQFLRRWIWEGFKLQPWRYENDDFRKLPEQKWIANRLCNLRDIPKQQPGYCKYEKDENWDTKLVILIEDETYYSHAKVVLKAIEFITSVFADKASADKYGFDWI